MILVHPFWLLLLLLLPLPWAMCRRKGYVGYSDVRLTDGLPGSMLLYRLPLVLVSLAFALLVIAVARPQRVHVEAAETIRARDIIVAVDISGSMGAPFPGKIPERAKNAELDKEIPPLPPRKLKPGEIPDSNVGKRRVDAAQAAVLRFVEDRYVVNAGDRIGIQVFDMRPRWSWPLTHDLKMIYRKGQFVQEGLGDGTNFGDIRPGPIDAAGEHFDELGKAVTKVFILVTDGEDNLSSSTVSRLYDLIKSREIHFYLVHVGDEDQFRELPIMNFTREVGGRAFRVDNSEDMAQCFRSIDQMERSVISVQTSTRHEDVFYYFAVAALVMLILGMAAEALILGQ